MGKALRLTRLREELQRVNEEITDAAERQARANLGVVTESVRNFRGVSGSRGKLRGFRAARTTASEHGRTLEAARTAIEHELAAALEVEASEAREADARAAADFAGGLADAFREV